MKKTLFVCAAMLVAAGVAKADFDGWINGQENGSVVLDLWSPGGHAWTAAQQPKYNNEEHLLLANGDRQRVLSEQAKIDVSMLFVPVDPHMLGYAFYTGYLNNQATFTITPSSFSADTGLIMMGIVYTGNTSPNPFLNYGSKSEPGEVAQDVNLGESIVVDDPNGDEPLGQTQFRVFTWKVSPDEVSDGFTITFTFPNHVAFSHIAVVQQVPEPSTYALLAGALGLAAVVVARRRRRA